jgi:hypothetical protein
VIDPTLDNSNYPIAKAAVIFAIVVLTIHLPMVKE